MSTSAPPRSSIVPPPGTTSPRASAAWELALDLFFESWRVSAVWSEAQARPFRRRALTLSRLIGVAAVTRSAVAVEVHLSAARQALADLEAELGRAAEAMAQPRSGLEEWIGWSTRLAVELSRWRLELISGSGCCLVTQNTPQIDS